MASRLPLSHTGRVDGTTDIDRLRSLLGIGLGLVTGAYGRRGGELVFMGERPGPGWVGHGYYVISPATLVACRVARVRLWKHRWRERATGRTCHSEPPDTIVRGRFSTLVLVLVLWGWLDGEAGLHRHRARLPELEGTASLRTLQRWLRRTAAVGLAIQQAVRRAIIERCEPRPAEHLLLAGRDPPVRILAPGWANPNGVEALWRGLALLFRGAVELEVPLSNLLAEARGRYPLGPDRFPF